MYALLFDSDELVAHVAVPYRDHVFNAAQITPVSGLRRIKLLHDNA
jgi:hypothetical protein